jgi:hypothetical protein
MHAEPTGGYEFPTRIRASPSPPLGTVQGFGVTDALRVELEPCQIATMMQEIQELRNVIGREATRSPVDEEEADTRRYEVRALEALQWQMTESLASSGQPALCGPATLVLELVAGAAHDAVQLLAEELDAKPVDAGSRDRLIRAAATASAWIKTYVDSRAVQGFTFDPDDGTPRL